MRSLRRKTILSFRHFDGGIRIITVFLLVALPMLMSEAVLALAKPLETMKIWSIHSIGCLSESAGQEHRCETAQRGNTKGVTPFRWFLPGVLLKRERQAIRSKAAFDVATMCYNARDEDMA